MANRCFFIKPSRPIQSDYLKLDPVLVKNNKDKNIETTVILDANIIIGMEKVIKSGGKWSDVKKEGLHNLVTFLQRCPPRSIFISSGHALNEMPPQLANQARFYYDAFCSKYLPGFVSAPGSERKEYAGSSGEYSFLDIPDDTRASLSITFSSILYLNIVDRFFEKSPVDKFSNYLDFLESKLDLLSATEIEIAKYCFWEPPSTSPDIIKKRRGIRSNNLKKSNGKPPKTATEMITVSHNAARDIYLLHSCNWADSSGLNGIRQDTWIATKDKKLVDFSQLFHHVKMDGEAGKVAASKVLPDHEKNASWEEINSCFFERTKKRPFEKKEMTQSELLSISDEAIKVAYAFFEE